MTELERFAGALLTQWRADGGVDGAPIAVSALLDRVLPYRVARRMLGIDVSEDYEALVLRLLAEDEDLVRVNPVDAADMAKATITSRLPDLDALQLLRSATVTLTERTIARLGDVLPMPNSREESKWATLAEPDIAPPPVATAAPDVAERVPARAKAKRSGNEEEKLSPRRDADAVPMHPAETRTTTSVPNEPPPDFLTTVTFTPPAAAHCWSCAESLPLDRAVKFCPFCGADQRQPSCAACGAVAERGWKHCADCGAKL